jgi:two-component system, chemotaxis family, response regulator PixH
MNTVLIVEDTMTDLQVAMTSLQNAGFAVVTAGNEQEAKAKIASKRPDLIVMDVVLPDRSGFELCRELKEEAATKGIPVVMCSTKGSNMDKYWGMQQGADAYLAKPVDTDELVKVVRRFI